MNYKIIAVEKLTRDEARKFLRDAIDYIQKLEEKNSELRSSDIQLRAENHALEKDLKRLQYSDEEYREYLAKWSELRKENELLGKTINLLNNEIGILKKGYDSIQQVVELQRELIVSRDRIIEGFVTDKEKTDDVQRKA